MRDISSMRIGEFCALKWVQLNTMKNEDKGLVVCNSWGSRAFGPWFMKYRYKIKGSIHSVFPYGFSIL